MATETVQKEIELYLDGYKGGNASETVTRVLRKALQSTWLPGTQRN